MTMLSFTKDNQADYAPSLTASEKERNDDPSLSNSLPSALYSRRDEFTRVQTLRIKIGTWNVAAEKDIDKDLGAWFVGGKGVAKELAGLSVNDDAKSNPGARPEHDKIPEPESFAEQEERYEPGQTSVPKGDISKIPTHEEIGIYALGVQELVDITSASEALRPYTDPTPANRVKRAMEQALPAGYELVAEHQMVGLLLLIYASPQILPGIRSVSTTSVGTGLMGYMGNKGAVVARILLGETTRLVFVNCHLSAGNTKADLERRNWDASQIFSRTKFDPITDSFGITQENGERIGDEDLCFWFGDLNYRLEGVPGDDVRRILARHVLDERDPNVEHSKQIDEFDAERQSMGSRENTYLDLRHSQLHVGSTIIPLQSPLDGSSDGRSLSSSNTLDDIDTDFDSVLDPASLQTTISSLLSHDELYQQQKAHKCFADGWKEGPISFLPTYKYDRGSVARFDSSEKKRAPSWCDRILYRTRTDRIAYEKMLKDQRDAKEKDDVMKAQGLDKAAADESTLFDYDPDADGEDENENDHNSVGPTPLEIHTKEGFDDSIYLEHYIPHQRVLSSDHKPLEAVFKLSYDAIVPELRAKVYQEVVRELDKAENEGRPTITIVIEGDEAGPVSDSNVVDFGKIRYGERKTQHLTLANTGLVRTAVTFVDELEKSSSAMTPEWLEIHVDHPADKGNVGNVGRGDIGKTFTFDPGDTCDVKFSLLIDKMPLVRELNGGKPVDGIVVLRIQDGRDHFIGLRGVWQPTSNGSTIDQLVRLPEGGIRLVERTNSTASSGVQNASTAETPVRWSAPREVFRLTEAIEASVERMIAEWSILCHEVPEEKKPPWQKFAGWPFEKESWDLLADEDRAPLRLDVFEALDTNESLDTHLPENIPPLHRLEILAEALLLFLQNLDDGVIPENLWHYLENVYFSKGTANAKLNSEDRKARILECLSHSPNHSVTFVFLMAMLARITKEIVTSSNELHSSASHTFALPSSPHFRGRRKNLSLDHDTAWKQLVQKSYATLFADVIFKAPQQPGSKWKMKGPVDQRRCEIIEAFLD